MAAAGSDHDGGHGADGDHFAIELYVALALEDEVDLGEGLVVVGAGIRGDIDAVDGGRRIAWDGEAAARGAAGAGLRGDFVELGEEVVFHGGSDIAEVIYRTKSDRLLAARRALPRPAGC